MGLKHGQGQEKFANGDSYTGEYTDGIRQGKGTLSCVSGEIYTGDFVQG